MSVINERGRQKVRFSLYLSSQLMMGLSHIYSLKSKYLYDDMKQVIRSIDSLYRLGTSNIDLQDPSSGFAVTFDEPDFSNAPIDFGSFSFDGRTSPSFLSYEYFLISTPRSSPEEWHISPGPPDDVMRATTSSGVVSDRAWDDFTARPEDITLPEAPIEEDQEAHEREVFREGIDAATLFDQMPVLEDEFIRPEPVERTEVPETEPEIGAPERDVQLSVTAERESPVAEDGQQFPDLAPDLSATSTAPAVLSGSRSTDEQSHASTDFELEPISVQDSHGRTRRRRRNLIIDQRIKISSEQMRRNQLTANISLHRPIVITSPKYHESAQSMLSRFGLSVHNNRRKFWPYPRTLPEPNDPSPFGHFIEEEPAVIRDVLADDTILSNVVDEQRESREGARAESSHDDTRSLLISQISSKSQLSLRQSRVHELSSARPSSSAPVVSAEDNISRIMEDSEPVRDICPVTMEALIAEALEELPQEPEIVQEPEIAQEPEVSQEPKVAQEREVPEEPQRDISHRTLTEIDVCPLDQPPPLSPDLPRNPLVEEAMSLLKEAFEDSDVPNQTTFSVVLSKINMERGAKLKKRYVAKLFYLILDFHATGVLYVRQTQLPDGKVSDEDLARNREIFISKGPNFYAF